jgi:hypothetical protein
MGKSKKRGRDLLLSTTMLSGVVSGAFVPISPATAADMSVPALAARQEPAVDSFNSKFTGLGGSMNGRSIYGGIGSVTFPLSGQYGAQIDGSVGALDHSDFRSIAGHLFWRNPSQALLGVYGSFAQWDRFGGVNVSQIAGEAEFYWGRFTLQGIAGGEFGNSVSSSNATFSTTAIPFGVINTLNTATQGFNVKTRFMDQINLKYYLNDDFEAYVGHRYLGGRNALALGSELAYPLGRGVLGSAFVEGRVGQSGFHGVWGGIKLYFGPTDKPLIARHRKRDPFAWGIDLPFSILNNGTSSTGSSSEKICDRGTRPNGTCEAPN